MYGIDIELSDYRIGSETISSGDDGYYEGCACDKDASTNAYSYDKCRVVRGTWRPSELVLYVGDEHVACRDVASGMHHAHLPGKVYFIEAEAGRDATAEGGVYTTVVEALSLVQEEEGTGMYLINAPEKAVVRFFKIEKSAAEEPQTVDPSVVESATGSGVDTQEEQEIDQEAPAIEEVEKVEVSAETKTEEQEVILEEGTLIDLEQPVAQVPVVAEAELPGVEAAEAIVPSLEENKLPEVVVAPEAQQLESAPEVSAPAQPESAVLGVAEGDLKSEVSVEADADVAQKEVISGQQEQEIAEALEGTEAPVEVKEETEVLLKEDTLIDLEQPVAQVPVVAEAELPGVEAAEAIVPSLEENKLPEVVVAPEAQQLESAPEVSAPAQPESTVLGVTEGDLKSEVSVEADADVAQKEVISGQQEQEIAEALEGTEAPVEVKEETEVLLKEDTLIDLEQPVAQVPVVAEAELPGVEAAEAIVPSLEENKLPEVVVAPEAQQLESAPEVSAPAQPESTVLGVTEGDLKSEVSVEADAGMQQELADVPTALPLKNPYEEEDVLSYLLARK
ncbi:SUMOylated effector protein AmpA [Anaplasma phagocytophilum]